MSWKNVKLIFSREVRDQLRDRRTLFMIAILPLLLYPALGIGMLQMMTIFREQPRTVVILGADNLPNDPEMALIEGNRFIRSDFKIPSDAEKLNVYTDADAREGTEMTEAVARIVSRGDEIRELARKQQLLTKKKIAWEKQQGEAAKETEKTADPFPRQNELANAKKELNRLVEGVQVLLIIPEGFGEHIETMNRRLASREFEDGEPIDEDYRPIILQNSADEKSLVAYKRVQEAISSWEDRILQKRLSQAKLPKSLVEPVRAEPLDLAEDGQISAFVWSKMFPALLVIMAVTGAFYPAVDLAAGEKERGTMETLLICPASRSEIVLGKFFTVMLFSVSTAILNLISMGLTGKYAASVMETGAFSKIGSLQPPSFASLVWIAVLMVPLAALFSAMCLALATFARSTKEGQYYLTPLLMVTMGLTLFCLSPGIEIEPFYSVMPVIGATLLLKEMLADPESMAAFYYGVPVLVTSVGYSLLALWWAIDQFSREDVLFREAERFELRLWIRHLLRDKEPLPSFTEAGFCFALIMLLQFGAMKFMNQAIVNAGPDTIAVRMMQILMIQQLVIIASPALFMGVLLTANFARTFRLRRPSLKMLALGAVLPFVLHPLSVELSGFLQKHFFLPLPESVVQQLQMMADPNQPLWLVLLAFAVAPAIGEELAFRGFILSGFGRSQRTWLAIGLSSLMFGLMHMIPPQVFNATLLGLVLGLLAVRSGSLLPGVVFHFLWNSLAVLHGRWGETVTAEVLDNSPWSWLLSLEAGQVHYRWPLLLICLFIGGFLLRRLIKRSEETTDDHAPQDDRQDGSPEPSFSDTDSASIPEEKPLATS